MSDRSKVIKATPDGWESISRREYKTEKTNFKSVSRYSLLTDDYPDLNFHTRYFEIEPGGYSSLEMHRHPHSVVILKGAGSVVLDNEIKQVQEHDVIFISPNTIHQFLADTDRELGFLCTVDRYRDKPVIPDDTEISNRITDKKVLKKIRK
ncbi:cupin domain-containing protein [Rhodohalobacter halophilus]|uniref:cupin domain-containing protein n=1 Tax=Rhodohalobacter halophilus TaxID=1812810 RepID=UPI00083FDAAB|nr:cupin domain-containing protein [Rhodohalobacter halophilus]